jgi:hypothetical protein
MRFARLALLAPLALLAAAPAAAQLTSSSPGKASIYLTASAHGVGGGDLSAEVYDTAAARRVLAADGTYASASASAQKGQIRAVASSSRKAGSAFAEAGMTTHLWFLNTTDQPIAQKLDGFFDGRMDYLGSEEHPAGGALVEMSLGVRNQWGWWVDSRYDSYFVPRLKAGTTMYETETSASAYSTLATSILIPPGVSDWYFSIWMRTEARGEFDADFSHTGNVFVPPTPGLNWVGDGAVLAEQYTPTWAGGSGPLPPSVTTPEPATVALFGGGLATLAAVARRRRATATA